MRRVRAFATAAASLAAVSLAAQQAGTTAQPPTFRSGTTLIEVSAIVTKAGHPVADLSREDLEIRDNGALQPLVDFEYVDLSQASGPEQRRDFVLLLDDLSISWRHSRQTIDLALALIDALGPHDRLAIVNTGPHELIQQLSTDRVAARRLVRRFRGQASAGDPVQDCTNNVVAHRVVSNVARAMTGDAKERRTILIVSEGHQVYLDESNDVRALPCLQRRTAHESAVATAGLANVAIYAVDPRGLVAPLPVIRATTGHEAVTAVGELAAQSAAATTARYHGSLGLLSRATGGTLVTDRNDLAGGLPGMIQDSRQYYRLAYAQPELAPDDRGKPRTISVRVARPGVTVRARQRYLPR